MSRKKSILKILGILILLIITQGSILTGCKTKKDGTITPVELLEIKTYNIFFQLNYKM